MYLLTVKIILLIIKFDKYFPVEYCCLLFCRIKIKAPELPGAPEERKHNFES